MDTARIGREITATFRLLVTEERRLLGGAALTAIAYALWVGITGVALRYGTEAAGMAFSTTTWNSTTTLILGLGGFLWVILPAGVVTYLTGGALTNASGSVRQYYRFKHPSLLAVPFLLLFAIGLGAGVALGQIPVYLFGILSVFGLFALVRTIAVSYRVFSFSRPLLVKTFLFLSLALTAVTILVSAATVAGRDAILATVTSGITERLGTSAVETYLTESISLGGVTVPYLLGVSTLLPAVLSLLYLGLQFVAGLINRVQKPDVSRSKVRTGQRHPDFAKPVSTSSSNSRSTRVKSSSSGASTQTAANGGSSSSAGSSTATSSSSTTSTASTSSDSSGQSTTTTADTESTSSTESQSGVAGTDDDEATSDDTSHTKVFTPPADDEDDDSGEISADEFESLVPENDDSGGTTESETAVVQEKSGYRCPSCDDRFDAGASFEFCPTCGSELEEE